MASLAYPTFDLNPQPQFGVSNPFGAVPGPIGLPDPYGDLNTAVGGNLGDINSSVFGNLMSMSRGQIPMADQAAMQDAQAAKAAAMGMPGTNVMPGTVMGNRSARDYGLTQMQLMNQAAQQYPALTGAVKNTQTVSPELQTQIAATNALNASAPNPTMAANYAQQLYDQYLQRARGPGGGTGGASMMRDMQSMIPQSTRDMSWFYQPAGGGGAAAPQTTSGSSSYDSGFDLDTAMMNQFGWDTSDSGSSSDPYSTGYYGDYGGMFGNNYYDPSMGY